MQVIYGTALRGNFVDVVRNRRGKYEELLDDIRARSSEDWGRLVKA